MGGGGVLKASAAFKTVKQVSDSQWIQNQPGACWLKGSSKGCGLNPLSKEGLLWTRGTEMLYSLLHSFQMSLLMKTNEVTFTSLQGHPFQLLSQKETNTASPHAQPTDLSRASISWQAVLVYPASRLNPNTAWPTKPVKGNPTAVFVSNTFGLIYLHKQYLVSSSYNYMELKAGKTYIKITSKHQIMSASKSEASCKEQLIQ